MGEPAKNNNEKLDEALKALEALPSLVASVKTLADSSEAVEKRLKALEDRKPEAKKEDGDKEPATPTTPAAVIDYDKLSESVGNAVGSKIESILPSLSKGAGADSGAGGDDDDSSDSKFDPSKATLTLSKAEYRKMMAKESGATGTEKAKVEARADMKWEADRREAGK